MTRPPSRQDPTPRWPEDGSLTAGVVGLLCHALGDLVLLPFRVTWAVISAPWQQRRMADWILGPDRRGR